MTINAVRVSMASAALLLFALVGGAALGADARPNSDEHCVAQCDDKSDKCMQDASDDEKKQKACDDAYEECLSHCK